jgi:hypothetical protein
MFKKVKLEEIDTKKFLVWSAIIIGCVVFWSLILTAIFK